MHTCWYAKQHKKKTLIQQIGSTYKHTTRKTIQQILLMLIIIGINMACLELNSTSSSQRQVQTHNWRDWIFNLYFWQFPTK